jgi:hypothetical protein
VVKGGCQGKGFKPLTKFRKDVFTFHSPETQFKQPVFECASRIKDPWDCERYGNGTV